MFLYFYDPGTKAWTKEPVKGNNPAEMALQWLAQKNTSGDTFVVTMYDANAYRTVLLLDGSAKSMIVLSEHQIFRQRLEEMMAHYYK
jgi:hypothetical protein